MNKEPKRYMITAALPYANGLKHIGHLAGAYMPADIYVRYLRSKERDVLFVCGSDEHGTAIPIQAMKEGTTARAIIDKYHPIIEKNFRDLGIDFDIYHRTSSQIHKETTQAFFTTLNDKGLLDVKESEQYYDEETNTFLADRYIKGTCPNCGYENAFGDQCEKCGTSLSPDMLINPVSTLSGNPPIKKRTKHWYLPLEKYEDFLRKWILEEHSKDWRSTVLGQCKSWLDGGLQGRAVTRDLNWGIPVPLPEAKGKVLYVWFDAPIGYISASKQWALDHGKDWRPYWEDPETKLVHFIGKDNIVFHCIIFPVMLKLHGNILPDNVPANEFMNLENDKMSTSRGWSIEMDDYIKDWIEKENGGKKMADVLRYYLTQIAPETKDSEFTWKGFQDANNNELVGILGNFINRTMVLTHKFCSGKVPAYHETAATEEDNTLIQHIGEAGEKIANLIEQYKFRDGLFEVMELARKGNQYLQKKQPWILQKELEKNPAISLTIDNCLRLCLELCAHLAILMEPFIPFSATETTEMLKVGGENLKWKKLTENFLLESGSPIGEAKLLFRKIEDDEINYQLDKLKKRAEAVAQNSEVPVKTVPLKDEIIYDDFAKMDLRAGTIVEAEKVPKTEKLLKLKVDLGFEQRCIVSGLAKNFAPEDIIGKRVIVVANLAPRKMKGIESKGMILMAEAPDGTLFFSSPDNNTPNGSIIC